METHRRVSSEVNGGLEMWLSYRAFAKLENALGSILTHTLSPLCMRVCTHTCTHVTWQEKLGDIIYREK